MSWPGAAAVANGEIRSDGGDGPPVVVKLGGARAVDPAGAVGDVAHLVANGRDVVVVHGGSTAVDDLLADLGKEAEYVETPSGVTGRFTDAETMEAFTMALAGQVNTDLVTAMKNAGVDAVGLSGVDGGLLTGPRKSAVRVVEDGKKKIKRGDHSGTPKAVNDGLLTTLLADGYTPVVSPPMFGMESENEGTPVNTDADRAAAAVAGALGAELVILTDVAGVYADPDDPDTLIESVATGAEYDALADAAEGFMTRKVMAATEALESGATAVTVADANVRDPIVAALDGTGTRIERSAVVEESAADAAADAEVDG
ncbi:acetylglutamate/acetylaminoadipate kinase [Halobaculum lipolyticum]|uniref:Putative [LysW]-aminoadipate/[LysW]-glutamate kinase n=1 Tax=Halobaculum lipolyticum TaxID=3032001 RepID=A0ABD5WD54_9EURY